MVRHANAAHSVSAEGVDYIVVKIYSATGRSDQSAGQLLIPGAITGIFRLFIRSSTANIDLCSGSNRLATRHP